MKFGTGLRHATLTAVVAATFLPMAGPYGVAAQAALTTGLQFWADFSAKNDAGTLTMADLEAVAAVTNTASDAARESTGSVGVKSDWIIQHGKALVPP